MADLTEGDHLRDLMREMDRRIEQRFEGQERAVAAALAAQEKAVAAALAAAKEAVSKAEQSSTQRLDAHNMLQGKLDRQAATFAEKEWVSGKVDALEKLIRGLEARIDRTEGRSGGQSSIWGYIALAISLAIGIATILEKFAR